MKKREVKNNNKLEKILLITLTVDAWKWLPKLGGGIFWRRQVAMMDAYPEERWLVEDGEVGSSGVSRRCRIGLVWRLRGDVIIWFCMRSQTEGGGVLCRWWRILLVVVAEAKWKLAQMVRKCNVERIKDKILSWHHSRWCTHKHDQIPQ